jgi:hypothetical protein
LAIWSVSAKSVETEPAAGNVDSAAHRFMGPVIAHLAGSFEQMNVSVTVAAPQDNHGPLEWGIEVEL